MLEHSCQKRAGDNIQLRVWLCGCVWSCVSCVCAVAWCMHVCVQHWAAAGAQADQEALRQARRGELQLHGRIEVPARLSAPLLCAPPPTNTHTHNPPHTQELEAVLAEAMGGVSAALDPTQLVAGPPGGEIDSPPSPAGSPWRPPASTTSFSLDRLVRSAPTLTPLALLLPADLQCVFVLKEEL